MTTLATIKLSLSTGTIASLVVHHELGSSGHECVDELPDWDNDAATLIQVILNDHGIQLENFETQIKIIPIP